MFLFALRVDGYWEDCSRKIKNTNFFFPVRVVSHGPPIPIFTSLGNPVITIRSVSWRPQDNILIVWHVLRGRGLAIYKNWCLQAYTSCKRNDQRVDLCSGYAGATAFRVWKRRFYSVSHVKAKTQIRKQAHKKMRNRSTKWTYISERVEELNVVMFQILRRMRKVMQCQIGFQLVFSCCLKCFNILVNVV